MTTTFKRFEKAARLPRSLSAWIKAAVADAQRLERTPGFELNMRTYNTLERADETGLDSDVCHVCLGGACLVAPGQGVGFRDVPIHIAFALDSVRTGDLEGAVEQLLAGGMISKKPSAKALERAGKLIDRNFNNTLGRASWKTYLKAADIVKVK